MVVSNPGTVLSRIPPTPAAPWPASTHWQVFHFQHRHMRIINFSYFLLPKQIITFLQSKLMRIKFNRYDSSQVTSSIVSLLALFFMNRKVFSSRFTLPWNFHSEMISFRSGQFCTIKWSPSFSFHIRTFFAKPENNHLTHWKTKALKIHFYHLFYFWWSYPVRVAKLYTSESFCRLFWSKEIQTTFPTLAIIVRFRRWTNTLCMLGKNSHKNDRDGLRIWICKALDIELLLIITYPSYFPVTFSSPHIITCRHGIVFQTNRTKHRYNLLNMD